jgi:hypothetical protein
VVGDVTRVGVAITNSETGGPLPVAKGYTLRNPRHEFLYIYAE